MIQASPGDRELDRAALPGSVVPCPLKKSAIAVGRCVEYQRELGCHCDQALVAIGFVEARLRHIVKTGVDPVSRGDRMHMRVLSHAEQQQQQQQQQELDQVLALKERALQLEAARPPAPPAEEIAMAKNCSKCGKELRVDNTKGRCGDAAACSKRAGHPADANGGGRP